MFYNFRKNKKAFTLVELIVVIAIIAILGAVVGVTVSTFVNRARRTAATSPLTSLAENWENNKMATGSDLRTLSQFIQDLYPNDTASFTSSDDFWGYKPADFTSSTKTFYIYFHNDDCGDYYGVLTIEKGEFIKSNVSTTETAPSSPKAFTLKTKKS